MVKKVVLIAAVIAALVGACTAQTVCPCAELVDTTCAPLQQVPRNPSACFANSVTCNKCVCVDVAEATASCNVVSAQTLVFVGTGPSCTLDTVEYAECPAVSGSSAGDSVGNLPAAR
eukprot:CAMPEP_0185829252 /NCGR_PEP_ID=MMETSP1353-20130828/140_1 /TAXON_ID=1077150 /ORGANISM="Erythrolobus australicus, Strain CCMP3124" /LENGTH=116 /DNA_ID=CAMNT_0028527017 /DNA_START=105 /DNA_END=455 /DNA_ORIENTATION=-